jgi:hypothetical protein
MLKPEERRERELLQEILKSVRSLQRELASLVRLLDPIQHGVDFTGSDHPTADQHTQPRPQATVRVIAQRSDAEIHQHQTDRQSTNTFQRKSLTVQWFLFAATLLAFGAAGYYAYIADQQRNAMVQANRINGDALTSVQRAFITFRGIEYLRNFAISTNAKNAGFSFASVWENTGATPAVNVLGYFSVDWVREGQQFAFLANRRAEFRKTVLGPKSTARSGGIYEPFGFWQPVTQETRLYFWGWELYRDVFSGTKVHLTEFCSDLVGVRHPTSKPPKQNDISKMDPNLVFTFEFGDCSMHNCSDEDCPDYNALELLWETHQKR